MKAARFHDRRDVRVETVPEPPGSRQVLVRNRFCGICGTDLHEYAAGPIFIPREPHSYTGAKLPQILGHEYGGIVVAIGDEVTSVAVGDRVSIQPMVAPRDDYYGRRGLYQLSESLGIVGLTWAWGGIAEYSLVNDYNAVRLPDVVSDEQAALIEPAAVTVYAADRRREAGCERAGHRGRADRPIAGAGGTRGASLIFLSDTNDNRLSKAREVLPDIVALNSKRGPGGRGDPRSDRRECRRRRCLRMRRGRGRAGRLHPGGAARGRGRPGRAACRPAVDGFTITCNDIDLRGSWCHSTLMWPRVASMLAAGLLPAEKIVTRRIRLSEVVDHGFEALLDPAGTELKILIDLQ